MKHKTYNDGILYNGNCLKVLPRLIEQGIKVDAVICDVPYGTTQCAWDSVIPFDKMWEYLNKITKENGAICLFGSQPFSSMLVASNVKNFSYEWVWLKSRVTNVLNAKKMPMRRHEQILVFNKPKTYNPQGLQARRTIEYQRSKSSDCYGQVKEGNYIQEFTNYPFDTIKFESVAKTVHPTQKPIDLMEYLIKTYTNEGETVLDFTCGSGSTLVACRNTKRRFIGIELTEKYYNISKRRLKRDCLKSIF